MANVKKGELLILSDTILIPTRDTVFHLPIGTEYRIEPNPEAKSDVFYDSLKVKAYRTRVTKELYNLMITGKKSQVTTTGSPVKSTSAYEAYAGKHIGHIRMKRVDVIEGDPDDTLISPTNKISKLVSKTHVYTREKVLSNTLFFKTGDAVSPDQLSDNERIIRSLDFIHDARILLVPRKNDEDTVDVVIITQDKFEYQFEINVISPTDFDLRLNNNSVFGMGKQLGINYLYNSSKEPSDGIILYYKDRNFDRAFVDIKVQYSNYWAKEGTEISLNKDFLTPQTKWGGGLYAGLLTQERGIGDYPDTSFSVQYTHNFQDAWVGRSFILGAPADRKNLTLTARVYREEYNTRPMITADSNYYFYNDVLAISGISYTRVSYMKNSMVKSFGVTEDMAIGHYIELNSGLMFGEYQNYPYLGLKCGWGRYDPGLGYFFGVFKVGGFIKNEHFQQGAYDLRAGYFTPLIVMNRWRFRQFFKLSLTGAMNRYLDKYINIKDQVNGLSGIKGDQRLALQLESVFFKPLSFYGFQMAFFIYGDLAMIGTGSSPEQLDTFYSSFGMGIRVRNEGLIIQNMEVKIGYIPKMPDASGKYTYGFSSSDPVLFRELSITKPDVVQFY